MINDTVMDRLLDLLTLEDLTPDLKLMVNDSNLDSVKPLLKTWDGERLKIPKINQINTLIKKYIEKFPQKSNYVLHRELEVPERRIRAIRQQCTCGKGEAK